jgi:hypothetical protein
MRYLQKVVVLQIVPELAQVLQTAFQMEESAPQLAPVAGRLL